MRTTIFASRRATATAVAVAIVAGALTLGGAIGLGLRLPGGWLGSAPEDSTELDYAALGRRLQRLRDGHVREVLTIAPAAAAASAAAATSDASPTPVAHAFTNDDFEHAYTAASLPFSAQSDARGATRQDGEPIDCVPAGGTSWYRYDATGPVALFANTFGTDGAAGLGVYTGDRIGQLTKVGCDLNALGNAQVGFRGESTTYWFQVTQPISGGRTRFELVAIGATTIESVTPTGGLPDGPAAGHPDVSGDGRFISFTSFATNLAPDWPGCGGGGPAEQYCVALYLRDRATGMTTRVALQGQPYNPDEPPLISGPSLTTDGRILAFGAYKFLPGEDVDGYAAPSEAPQVAFSSYLYDRATGRVKLVSRNAAGEPARSSPRPGNYAMASGAWLPSVSSDGRFVTFISDSENMGTHRTAADGYHVYRRDLRTGEVRLVSTDSKGEPLHGESCTYSSRNVSADGRFVVFMNSAGASGASGGGNGALALVYLWDAVTGSTRIVSKLPAGTSTLGNYCPAISRDGTHVGFVSRDALLPEDNNGTPDVYVYDIALGDLRRVSVTSSGQQTVDPNYPGEETTPVVARAATLSADGRYAVFDSAAPDLVPLSAGGTGHVGSTPGPRRIYLHDLVTGATRLVSVTSTGEPLSGESSMPYISADGTTVVFFNRDASGLVNVVSHELR